MNFLESTMKEIVQTRNNFYDIEIIDLNGNPIDLEKYRGKKLLIVNVASKCGFTNQYKDLQHLHEQYNDMLNIIGVPCNQFGKQEPGNSKAIQEFCQLNYGVTFQMTEKINVKGKKQHPLYKWLTKKTLNGRKNSTVRWNFQKYLIDENGSLMNYFYSTTKPLSTKIINLLKQ